MTHKKMEYQIVKIYHGKITEHEEDLSIFQLCSKCDLSPEIIIELVDEGILEPAGGSKREWRFTFGSIDRVRKLRRLQKDLELNIAGAILAVQLLDRIEMLEY